MSYNVKYSASFYDCDGTEINIYIKQKDFTGIPSGLTLDASPLLISYPNQELLSNIYGCGCQINIKNTSGNLNEYDNLFAHPENEYIVHINKGGNTIYSGYILPEMYEQDILQNSSISIPSSSFLNLLDRYTPNSITTSGYTYVKLIDIIKEILSITNGSDGLLVYSSLINGTYSPSSTNNYYDNNFILKQLFINTDGSYKNSKEILESILKSFNSRIYQYKNYFIIDRIKDTGMTGKTYKWYDITGTTISTVTINDPKIEISDQYILNRSAKRRYEAGKKNVVVKLDYKNINNLTSNDFSNTEITGDPLNTPIYIYVWKIKEITDPRPDYSYSDSEIFSGIKFKSPNALTCRVMFGASSPDDTIPTILKINYKIKPYSKGIDDGHGHKRQVKIKYAIRAYTYWDDYIAVDSGGTYYVTSTPYYFHSSDIYSDFDKNGYVIKISDSHNITEIIDDLTTTSPSNRNGIILFLDFYSHEEKYDNISTWTPQSSCFGDLVVSTEINKSENEITGTINNDYSGKIETTLDIFDEYNLSSSNGLYYLYGTHYEPFRFTGFTDTFYTTPIRLYEVLISDIIQLYNKPRFVISSDIKMRTNTNLGIGRLFTYDYFRNTDNSLKEFISTGYEYNVKENSYRITLNEFKMDDDYRI